MNSSELRNSIFQCTLVIGALVLNITVIHRLGLFERTSGWVGCDAIPVAISRIEYQHPFDYTGLTVVRDAYRSNLANLSDLSIQCASKNTLIQLGSRISNRETYLPTCDDKGIFDFVTAASLLFGYSAAASMYMYLLLLLISACIFCVSFAHKPNSIFILLAFLCAHACVLPMTAYYSQFDSPVSMRFMTVLAVIPAMHFIMELFRSEHSSLGTRCIVCFTLQLGIMAFLLHLRIATLWAVLAVACCGAVCVLLSIVAWRRDTKVDGSLNPIHRISAQVALTTAVLALPFCLSVYQRAVFSPSFYSTGTPTHVFWHTLATGLGYSPELARRYKIKIDDISVIAATGDFLREHGDGKYWQEIGGTTPNYSGIRYYLYDAQVRRMFFNVIATYPLDSAAAFVLHKPVALTKYVGWWFGIVSDVPRPELLWESGPEELRAARKNMEQQGHSLLSLLPWCVAFVFTSAICCHTLNSRPIIGSAVFLFFGTLLPSIIGYPSPHTISEAMIGSLILCFLALGVGLQALRLLPQFATDTLKSSMTSCWRCFRGTAG